MAIWPSSAATAANLFTAVNALATTLSSGINNSVTTIPLTSTTGFPTAGAVLIDQEIIFYTGVSGSNLTGAIRGSDGTSAAAHSGGVPVSASIVAFHHNGLMQEIAAIESWLQTNVVANPLTANLAAGGFKITGLAAGTTNGDSIRYEQVIGQYLLLAGGTMAGNIDMGSNKITGLAAATAGTDVPKFAQVKVLQIVTATSSTATTTTSTSFVDTNLTITITPTLASSTIIIFAAGSLYHSAAGFSGVATLANGTTSLLGTNGQAEVNISSTSSAPNVPASLLAFDSPASISAQTYKVRIKTMSGSGTTGWISGNATAGRIIAMEINGL